MTDVDDRTARQRVSPWSRADQLTALISMVAGAVLVAWGWIASSGEAKVSRTVPGVVFGIVAVGLVASAAASWVKSGRQAVRARALALTGELDVLVPIASAKPTGGDGSALVMVAGSNRAHRRDCLLVRGKPTLRVALGSARADAATACEMCRP